jgi:hypothetical protein
MDQNVAAPDQIAAAIRRWDRLSRSELETHALWQLWLDHCRLRQCLVRQLDVARHRVNAVDGESKTGGQLERVAPFSAP